ncbi:hypothetical protein CAOG_05133 [Capsaspora owczarzaki ATCC 30864]|uniref:Ras-related protein Rab-24 n=1 Tax=Capsaspora owczarzaki (strain ATCC 30864) TaxID=595528 RepID=A0A0D2X3L1_CAPO3|nr:hypothetical protein CAOG_05133 [Capsaspora owczarzaki ATCC 30864]KJE94499.1 hypothetical protein CAOG_005133 [Capsaspora owczarzaki ATCC 30864]|eukprot:XP_004346818.1 hypothetical protein CAOG_05133 [Capsaspora owczarzaki ATCC 30864]
MTAKVDLKVVLLGREASGKTCLVDRYLHDRFNFGVNQATVGAAFGAKKLQIGGHTITMGIWDTAGSERYEAMSRIYYRGAKAAITCFDVMDPTSFERLKFWVNELRNNEEHCKLYICGTKVDIAEGNRSGRVDVHSVSDYADEVHARYFDTSSKTGQGIQELFTAIAEDFIQSESKTRTLAADGATVPLARRDPVGSGRSAEPAGGCCA